MKKFIISLFMVLSGVALASASHIDTLSIETPNLPEPENVLVVVPDAASHSNRMPVVFLLNGYGGDEKHWLSVQPAIKDIADTYGMIVVTLAGHDTWYVNSTQKPELKMESFIIDDLVPYIDKNYPTKAEARYRAITGLSMGGHGALRTALLHRDVFGNAGSTSGGVNITNFPKSWNLPAIFGDYEQNRQNWENNAVYYIVDRLEPGDINIIFDCGVDDFFAKDNQALHEKLVEKKWPHDYISRPGNHSGKYWKNSILYQLLYFNEAFDAADALAN